MECRCSQSKYQCVLCCKVNKKGLCTPHTENKTTSNDSMIKLLPGSPCDNFQGYCDVLSKCHWVNCTGSLDVPFGGDVITNSVDLVKNYWWTDVLIGVGLVLVMAGSSS